MAVHLIADGRKSQTQVFIIRFEFTFAVGGVCFDVFVVPGAGGSRAVLVVPGVGGAIAAEVNVCNAHVVLKCKLFSCLYHIINQIIWN